MTALRRLSCWLFGQCPRVEEAAGEVAALTRRLDALERALAVERRYGFPVSNGILSRRRRDANTR